MRVLNVCAALSGVIAIVMLVIAAHAVQNNPEAVERIRMAGYMQLFAAITGLVIANRSGRLNLIAGAMILSGAALFAGVLYAMSLTGERSFVMLAPVGGITLILGWALLVFAKPRQ